MSKYLPSKQGSKHKLTRQQVYRTVYHDNAHLSEDKASRVQLMDELGVRYVNI